MPQKEFINNFRLNKDAFEYILNEVRDKFPLRIQTSAIPPILKVAAALRFFAAGSYQRSVGNDLYLGLAQATVSIVLKEFLDIMEDHVCAKLIRGTMTQEEKREAKLYFFQKTGFPCVIGCIDGTHVGIVPPKKEHLHIYRNRKGFFSLNAMIVIVLFVFIITGTIIFQVCDHNMIIRSVDARYGGATHDSLIWNLSRIRRRLEESTENDVNSWYLGDAGYPLEPFLITPFRATASRRPEARFNHVHSKTRNIVEGTIGVLKSRFKCLHTDRTLHYEPEKATSIVNSCSALHNICTNFKVPEIDIDSTELSMEEIYSDLENQTAQRIRANIMESLQNQI